MPLGEAPTRADRAFLERRYGKARYETASVAHRCWKGYPAVHVAYYSSDRETVVSNLYWVSCPDLSLGLAALEAQGVIRSFQCEIAADPSLTRVLQDDHKRYDELRKAWLSWANLDGNGFAMPHSQPKAHSSASFPMERTRKTKRDRACRLATRVLGVGGVAPGGSLKCLHSHVAFRLATGVGLVGDRALALLEAEGRAPCFVGQVWESGLLPCEEVSP